MSLHSSSLVIHNAKWLINQFMIFPRVVFASSFIDTCAGSTADNKLVPCTWTHTHSSLYPSRHRGGENFPPLSARMTKKYFFRCFSICTMSDVEKYEDKKIFWFEIKTRNWTFWEIEVKKNKRFCAVVLLIFIFDMVFMWVKGKNVLKENLRENWSALISWT